MIRQFATALLSGAATLALCGGSVLAAGTGKSAGDLLVRARGILVVPDDAARISGIGGDTELSDEVVPELDFTWFFTDNLGFELILGTTSHQVEARRTTLGNVDLGSVNLLPPTITVQWHFFPEGPVSPYVGAGINYTIFYDVERAGPVTSIDYDDAFGWALQAGVDVAVTDRLYLNLDVKKIFLETDVRINNAIDASVEINPWILGVGVGYRFDGPLF